MVILVVRNRLVHIIIKKISKLFFSENLNLTFHCVTSLHLFSESICPEVTLT